MKNFQRALVSITSIAAFLAASSPVSTEASLESLVEACYATDPDLVQLLENEAFIVNPHALEQNLDGSWTLAQATYDWTYMVNPEAGGDPVCPTSRFFGQSQIDRTKGLPFRSAVQVGPDLILTAWHSDFDPDEQLPLKVVFGLRYRIVSDNCVPPDFNHIPDADVFQVTEVVADGYDQFSVLDFLVLRLDRNASTTYPRVRRSGGGRGEDLPSYPGDRVTIIGHPERLATKVDLDGRLYGYNPLNPPWSVPWFTNLHPIDFNSGSMVYNRDEKFVETVAKRKIAADYDDLEPGCLTLVQSNEDPTPWESTHFSISTFADHIPAFELLVTPLDTVTHECYLSGPAGGSCTYAQFDRTISAPSDPGSGIAYQIQPPSGTAPELIATFGGPLQGSLPAGSSFGVHETVNLTGASPGTYTRTYKVRDLTHGFNDTVRHIFNVHP